MKRQLFVKIFAVLALIIVLATSLMTSVSAEMSINTSVSSGSDYNLSYLYSHFGTNREYSVWSDGTRTYYLRFVEGFSPSYIVCKTIYGSDVGGYQPTTVLYFYDSNFNEISGLLKFDYWVYYHDGLVYGKFCETDQFFFGYYLPDMACLQFSGTAIFDGEVSMEESYIYAIQQNVIKKRNDFGLFYLKDIDDLFRLQAKDFSSDDSSLFITSSKIPDIFGYNWVSGDLYDRLHSDLVSSYSELEERNFVLESLHDKDLTEAYEQGKAAAYSEYNAVSGLIDGAVNTVSATVGFFFDNIKVGTVTLGGVISILVIFLVVVLIYKKVN